MFNKRWAPIALAAFAAGVLVAPVVAGASLQSKAHGASHAQSPAAVSAQVVTKKVSIQEQRATLRYWTPQRMSSAKSLDIITRSGAPTNSAPAPAANGAAAAVAPRLPGNRRITNAVAIGNDGVTPFAFSYPFPFDRHQVYPRSLYTKYPWVVNGKVFFTQNGGNFVCSGTAVTATNLNEVWTAGHCVNNGAGVFDSFAEFVPAYNGAASNCCAEGIFVANNYVTSSSWSSSGDLRQDLGAMTVNANSSGVQLQNAVGSAGFAYNQATDQQFVDFGYPAASPFNGNFMVECLGATAVSDTAIPGTGAAPTGIGCDMTGGSSGGSWQTHWGGNAGNAAGYINGHNDYKYNNQPLAMYSPYFDTLANNVRCALEPSGSNGC